jgi:hypothetical protein
VLGLGVDGRKMHFWTESCCCPNLLAFALPFIPLGVQSGDELEDLRAVVLTNTSSSVVLAVPGL